MTYKMDYYKTIFKSGKAEILPAIKFYFYIGFFPRETFLKAARFPLFPLFPIYLGSSILLMFLHLFFYIFSTNLFYHLYHHF